jgi:hypothetical protein
MGICVAPGDLAQRTFASSSAVFSPGRDCGKILRFERKRWPLYALIGNAGETDVRFLF